MSPNVDAIVAQVKALPPEEQLQLAEAVDRLTWARRWRRICERIEAGYAGRPTPSEQDIEMAVHQHRARAPLHAAGGPSA